MNHRLYQKRVRVSAHLHLATYLFNVHQFTGGFMKIHFILLRFELALGKNLFNDSRLVVDSEPTVGLCHSSLANNY